MRNNRLLLSLWLLSVMLFIAGPVVAQLNVSFTADKQAGCSPLTVSFTNTTTGASAAATYQWDFGNGKSAVSKDGGSIYTDEQSYTVKLTVTDGGASASATKEIIVYKKPAVSISYFPNRGCASLSVSFGSTVTTGNGASVASYLWDFGDGSTTEGSGINQPVHIYGNSQTATVSLTVKDSHGCSATYTQANAVQILQAAIASFTTDKTTLCTTTDKVTFTNKSSGPGTLTYRWDFGDGTTSTEVSPVHAYTVKGTYKPVLTVTSSEGCTNTYTLVPGINVADLSAGFTVPVPVCTGSDMLFTTTNNPAADYTGWTYSDGGTGNPRKFATPGDYTVTMTAFFGSCQVPVTKNIKVLQAPALNGITLQSDGSCGAPANITFTDTGKAAIKWQWTIDNNAVSTTASASYLFNNNGNHTVALTITDAIGCSSTYQTVYYLSKPSVYIYTLSSSSANGLSGCEGLTATFSTISSEAITSYNWNFGDGGSSADAQPKHTFAKAGVYNVVLNYVTVSGCKGQQTISNVVIYKNPDVDFTMAESNPICGNTPVHFNAVAANSADNYYWYYEGDYTKISYAASSASHQYTKEGTYSVYLVAVNGTCRDTVEKKLLVTVLPPFPKVGTITNTCAGERTFVTIADASAKVLGWQWDFGDGSGTSYTTAQSSVSHTYAGTGSYKVVLTGINGQCSVRDSAVAYVFAKQHPQLTVLTDIACGSDSVPVLVTNQDANPMGPFTEGDFSLSWKSSPTSGILQVYQPPVYEWNTVYKGSVVWLPPGADSIQAITVSNQFGCRDTTNFAKVHIKGPTAVFDITSNGVCYNTPNVFTDKSSGYNNVPIASWKWGFGDSTGLVYTEYRNTVTHIYADPGADSVYLTVYDAEGCFDTAVFKMASVTGPKADFTFSPSSVKPGTTVSFTNTTNLYNITTAQYLWLFSYDNSSSTLQTPPSKKYNAIGVDTVMLIASNPFSNCRDTVVKYIHIKTIEAAFTYTATYTNGNNCPPLLVSFVNKSDNATSISWNFGDGATGGNSNNASHTYTLPGKYVVTLYAYDGTGDVDSVSQTIEVKGPYGTFTANHPQVCGAPATVTFTATTTGTTDLTWDMADGTLLHTKDYTITYTYTQPGTYNPGIILKDDKGCEAVFNSSVPLLIDTLHIAFQPVPAVVCDSGRVQFKDTVTDIGADKLNLPLYYHWNFGTGMPADTSAAATPVFFYNANGSYTVHLTVTSAAGCVKDTVHIVTVKSKTHGVITGPDDLCRGVPATFNGSADGQATAWSWHTGDGTIINDKNVLTHTYQQAGDYSVLLIIGYDGCMDTASHNVVVHEKPLVALQPGNAAVLCAGDSLHVVAHNGVTYLWTPDAAISNSNVSDPYLYPADNTVYHVWVTDNYGCISNDSIAVRVAKPFTVSLSDTSTCNGTPVILQASGADNYEWLSGNALSSTTVADPSVTPAATNEYMVVGHDKDGCFTDTAHAVVTVYPKPEVNTIEDTVLLAGTSVTLQTTGSSNAVAYRWAPSSYLDCPGCQSPVSTPRTSLTYVVTALTAHHCIAMDTVVVTLRCEQSSVFIPNTFTPNKDGRNDLFYPRGKGIRLVKYFRIYNRLGEMIFEKLNFAVNDPLQGWDGSFTGNAVTNNVFSYVAEMICDGGDTFLYKGTVLLLR